MHLAAHARKVDGSMAAGAVGTCLIELGYLHSLSLGLGAI